MLAILLMLLPFALLLSLVEWQREPHRAALIVSGFGIFQLVGRRHSSLARIPSTQLGLWSFVIAIAHGAGLMLVPIYLGLCGTSAYGHEAADPLVEASLGWQCSYSVFMLR